MHVCVLELCELFMWIHVCVYMNLCMYKEAKEGHRAVLPKALLYSIDRWSLIELGGSLAASKSHWSSYFQLLSVLVTASIWNCTQIFTWMLGIQTHIKPQALLPFEPSLRPLWVIHNESLLLLTWVAFFIFYYYF